MAIAPAETAIPSTSDGPVRVRVSVASVIEGVAAIAVLATYALYVVPRTGGREGDALFVGLGVTTAALMVMRAWRFLTARTMLLLASIPAAAAVVCLLSPTGASGLGEVATYAYAVAMFACVAAWARTAARRQYVPAVLCVLGIDQFRHAFLPWWGGESASHPMLGSFYWHNQFGAYMLALALASGVMAVFGRGVGRRMCAILAPLFSAAVVLSASRGCLLLLVTGWAAVGATIVLQRTRRRRSLAVWAALVVATVLVGSFLTSSALFPPSGSGTGLSAVDARNNSAQTATENAKFRVAHAAAAFAVATEHPLAGAGFDMYAPTASRHLPFGLTRSPYAHNGYLQAAADGGLLLFIPLIAALLAAIVAAARHLLPSARALSLVPVEAACAVGAAALLLHSAIDIDWTYPALGALVAGLLAVAGGRDHPTVGSGERRRRSSNPWSAGVFVAILLVALTGLRYDATAVRTTTRPLRGGTPDQAVALLLQEEMSWLPDSRLQVRALAVAVPTNFEGRISISPGLARVTFERTKRLGARDALVQMQRAQLLAAFGDPDKAVAMAAAVIEHEGAQRPFLSVEYAETLAAAGRRTDGVDVLVTALNDPGLTSPGAVDQVVDLYRTLERLASPVRSPETLCALARARELVATAAPSAAGATPAPSRTGARC